MEEKHRYTKKQFKAEFAKRIEETSIPSNLSDSERIKCYRELFSFTELYIPEKLFRFRKCDLNSTVSFEQGTIPVCVASRFPDKYDSTVYYDFATLENRAKSVFSSIVPKFLSQVENNSPIIDRINPLVLNKARKLLNGSKSENEILEDLWAEFKSPLSDWKTIAKIQEQRTRSNTRAKIACFSEIIKSKFMWDNYADGYKGFAVEYDFRKWFSLNPADRGIILLLPIIYTSKKMDATEMIDRLVGQIYLEFCKVPTTIKEGYAQNIPIDNSYFIKPYIYKDKKEYAREKEWRLLDLENSNNPDADKDFSEISDGNCLMAIYYGPDMNTKYKAYLRKIAKQKEIREYDVLLDTSSRKYDLKLVRL